MSDEEFVPKDFVYSGLRLSVKNTLIACIRLLEGGKLGEELCYDSKLFKGRVIGGVYTGALFGDKAVKLSKIHYTKKWDDWIAVEGWTAQDQAAQGELKYLRMEEKERKTSELDKALLPWRKAYSTYIRQHDMLSAEALVHMVTRSLRKPYKE